MNRNFLILILSFSLNAFAGLFDNEIKQIDEIAKTCAQKEYKNAYNLIKKYGLLNKRYYKHLEDVYDNIFQAFSEGNPEAIEILAYNINDYNFFRFITRRIDSIEGDLKPYDLYGLYPECSEVMKYLYKVIEILKYENLKKRFFKLYYNLLFLRYKIYKVEEDLNDIEQSFEIPIKSKDLEKYFS